MKKRIQNTLIIFSIFLTILSFKTNFTVSTAKDTRKNSTIDTATGPAITYQDEGQNSEYPKGLGYDKTKIVTQPCPSGTAVDISKGNITINGTEWRQGDNVGEIDGALILTGINSTNNTITMNGILPKIVFKNIKINGPIKINPSNDLDIGFYGNNTFDKGYSNPISINNTKPIKVFFHSYDFKKILIHGLGFQIPNYNELIIDNLNIEFWANAFQTTAPTTITNSCFQSNFYSNITEYTRTDTPSVLYPLETVVAENVMLNNTVLSIQVVTANFSNLTLQGNFGHSFGKINYDRWGYFAPLITYKNLTMENCIYDVQNLSLSIGNKAVIDKSILNFELNTRPYSSTKTEKKYNDQAIIIGSNSSQILIKNSTLFGTISHLGAFQYPIQFSIINDILSIENSSVKLRNLNNDYTTNVQPIDENNESIYVHKIKIPNCIDTFVQTTTTKENNNLSEEALLKTDNNGYLYLYLPRQQKIKISIIDPTTSQEYEAIFDGTNTGSTIVEAIPTTKTKPTIIAQSADQLLNQNSKLTLYVVAIPENSANTLAFQWYKDNVIIPGATQSTYVVSSVTGNDSGSYKCVVKEQNSGSVTSNDIVVTVNRVVDPDAPIIISQSSVLKLVKGSDVTLKIEANSSNGKNPISYQWYKDNKKISGETSNTIVINDIDSVKAGIYKCEVKDLALNTIIESATVTIILKK